MTLRVGLVVLVVVLAGCSVPAEVPGSDLGSEPTAAWSETELVVGLTMGVDEPRDKYAVAVQDALAYWGDNAPRYLDHPVNFRFVPDAEDPDVEVTVVESVTDCGREDHVAGCAPKVGDLRTYDETADVRIRAGLDRESTALTTKHELGHVFGLSHADPPRRVMQAHATLAVEPQPNATERPLPWNHSTLSVYVDDENLSPDSREGANRQVDHALGYFADGAEGTVPENVSFTRVDDSEEADVVVHLGVDDPCQAEPPISCSRTRGVDPDRDGAREYYTRLDIYVSSMEGDAMGWHTARWLALGLGIEDEVDLPPPLRDTSYRDRRSDWWT